MVSRVVKECRFKANLACLPLQVWDDVSEATSCLKDRKLLYDVYC